MRPAAAVLVILCLCGLTFVAGLGRPALTDSDEAFYAEGAREMRARDDWLTPYFNDVPRFEKPVLYYWLAGAFYHVAGPSAGAARLPSALAGLGLVLIAYACGRRWYDPATAHLAAIITATSFGLVAMARQALPDLPLAFFVTLAIWLAMVGLLDPPPGTAPPASRRPWVVGVGVAAAAAFLVKGPVGLALLGLVLGPVVIVERWRTGARWPGRPADLGWAVLVGGLLAAPWYGAMTLEHGAAYLERFFLAENLDRFVTARYNAPRPWWYYLPIVVGGLLPWSAFMPLWSFGLVRAWRRRRADRRALRLVWWAAAPLLFYTVSVGKQPRYVLPVLVPLAVLLARALAVTLATDTPGARRAVAACGLAAGGGGIVLGALVYRARPILIEWPGAAPVVVAAALVVTGLALAGAAARSMGPRGRPWVPRLPGFVAAAAVVANLGAHTVILASPGLAPVERMAALIARERAGGVPYGRYRVFDRNLIFYVHAPHVELSALDAARDFLRLPHRVLCVLRAEDAAALHRVGVELHELGAVSYLNTGSLTLRTLLDPDPARDVLRVVLVSNY